MLRGLRFLLVMFAAGACTSSTLTISTTPSGASPSGSAITIQGRPVLGIVVPSDMGTLPSLTCTPKRYTASQLTASEVVLLGKDGKRYVLGRIVFGDADVTSATPSQKAN